MLRCRRRVLRMVLQPLLDRFISYQEPKSLFGICVRCPLDIEVPERRRVRKSWLHFLRR